MESLIETGPIPVYTLLNNLNINVIDLIGPNRKPELNNIWYRLKQYIKKTGPLPYEEQKTYINYFCSGQHTKTIEYELNNSVKTVKQQIIEIINDNRGLLEGKKFLSFFPSDKFNIDQTLITELENEGIIRLTKNKERFAIEIPVNLDVNNIILIPCDIYNMIWNKYENSLVTFKSFRKVVAFLLNTNEYDLLTCVSVVAQFVINKKL
jgi:hypothetical protein